MAYVLIMVAIALALLPVALASNLLALPCLLAYGSKHPNRIVSWRTGAIEFGNILAPMAAWMYIVYVCMVWPPYLIFGGNED